MCDQQYYQVLGKTHYSKHFAWLLPSLLRKNLKDNLGYTKKICIEEYRLLS